MKSYVAAGIILIAVFAAYSNSFQAGFQFDDNHQIVANENIRYMEDIPRFFTDASLATHIAGKKGYRPVTLASFAINYAVSGYSVWSYHLLNMLLHFINALLVYAIIRALFKEGDEAGGDAAALVAALLFAVHPIQTGAVTYISGRAALLASFFYLLAFLCFLRFRAGGPGRYFWAFPAPLLYLLGLLSKEMAVSLPVVCMAYDLLFALPKMKTSVEKRRLALYYMPLMAALAIYLIVKRGLQGFVGDYGRANSVMWYLMSEAKALLLYLRLLVLPVNQNADYNLPQVSSVTPLVVFSAMLVVAALVLLYRQRGHRPALAFFGLWFFIALAPESSLVPISDTAVEYRLYLPSIGFITAATVLFLSIIKADWLRKASAAFLLLTLSVLTLSRNAVWATEYSLWSDTVKKAPYSARALEGLGHALLVQKKYAEAVEELKLAQNSEAVSKQPYNIHNDLGVCYLELGMYDEALREFGTSVKIFPGAVEALNNMGTVYFRQGRFLDAERPLLMALKIDPGYYVAHFQLGLVYMKLSRTKEAIAEMERAAELSPGNPDILHNLALLQEIQGMQEGATQ